MRSEPVILGRIAGVYGVRGWLKVFSETKPKENIFSYRPWLVRVDGEWQRLEVLDGRPHGKGLVAQLAGYDDRESARRLVGAPVAVQRQQLPPAAEGEYYWADLVGLRVVTPDGVELGRVDHLLETGANDVLVVNNGRERLIPFVQGQYVQQVDLDAGLIRVDWDPEF